MTQYVRVAVPRPLYRTFLYRVPRSLAGEIRPGSRVVVPFGRRELTGWVDELVSEPADVPAGLKEILDAPDDVPVVDTHLLALCRWIARYYAAPLGLTLRAALPAALTAESSERIRLPRDPAPADLSQPERRLLDYVQARRGPVKLGSVRKALGPGPWSRTARRLADDGILELVREAPDVRPPVATRQVARLVRRLESLQDREELFGRAPRQRELYEYLESVGGRAEVVHLTRHLGVSRSVVDGLAGKGVVALQCEVISEDPFAETPIPAEERHIPSPAQADAIGQSLRAAATHDPGVFVLKGVTGSGKTLVYIEVLRELVNRRGRGAILLVPEISLTPQTLNRFRAAFGEDVALFHSALSDSERYSAWRALKSGEKRIVIGARSAVFAPVRDLGAIIVDEEHEGSYKQNDPAPRYHAREVAVMRARRAGALTLLGSATPSLETWAQVGSGAWTLLELPERIGARPLPQVRLVDLREGPEARAGEATERVGPHVLSAPLQTALEVCLERGEQAVLLLNRRGYSNFTQCRDCGAVRSCWQCNVSLTEHRRPARLVCHHCNHQEPIPTSCPECGSANLGHRGVGTEQVERVLGETFPSARLARMDVDTTTGKWSHRDILRRVERREVDVLLGTQMIAKGLDFPNVTLVGVINADVGLNLPDFRASERTFQLLTQVAGRAGRGPRGGAVIIQTFLPDHYAIRFALNHDYEGFAEHEAAERSGPGYPPFTRLANLVISGPDERQVQGAAETVLQWLDGLLKSQSIAEIDLLGPAPCPIDRVRRRWRWHLLLKSGRRAGLGHILRYFAHRFPPPSGDLRIEIDRDPTSLL